MESNELDRMLLGRSRVSSEEFSIDDVTSDLFRSPQKTPPSTNRFPVRSSTTALSTPSYRYRSHFSTRSGAATTLNKPFHRRQSDGSDEVLLDEDGNEGEEKSSWKKKEEPNKSALVADSSLTETSFHTPLKVSIREDSVRLLERQLNRMQSLRRESREKDKRILELERSLEATEFKLEDGQFALSRVLREKASLEAKILETERTMERDGASTASKLQQREQEIEELKRQVEETRRSLHQSEHAQAVAEREAAIAKQARVELEKSNLARTAALQDEVRTLRSERKKLSERLAEVERTLERVETQREGAECIHKAKIRELENKATSLEDQLKRAEENSRKAETDAHVVEKLRDSERATAQQLAVAQERLARLAKQSDEIEKERKDLALAVAQEKDNHSSEHKLRLLAEERCRTLREQVDMLVAGNNAIQIQKEDVEKLRREVDSASRLVQKKDEQITTLHRELAEARAKLETSTGELEAWSRSVQSAHHTVASICAGGSYLSSSTSSSSSSSSPSAGSSTTPLDKLIRMPDSVRSLLRSLESLDKMTTQLRKRVKELETSYDTIKEDSEHRKKLVGDLQSRLDMVLVEKEQYQADLSAQTMELAHYQEELDSLQCAFSTLQQELENERRSHRKNVQGIRRAALKSISMFPHSADSARVDDINLDSDAEELVYQICTLFESSIRREQHMQQHVQDLQRKLDKLQEDNEEYRFKSNMQKHEPLVDEKKSNDELEPDRISEETLRREKEVWKKSCFVFVRIFGELRRLVSRLASHKLVLSKLCSFQEKRQKALRDALRRTGERLRSLTILDDQGDGPSHASPSSPSGSVSPLLLRTVVLAVIAAKRLEILGKKQSRAKYSPLGIARQGSETGVELCPDVFLRIRSGDMQVSENDQITLSHRLGAVVEDLGQGRDREVFERLVETFEDAGAIDLSQSRGARDGLVQEDDDSFARFGSIYALWTKPAVDKELEAMEEKVDSLAEHIKSLTVALSLGGASFAGSPFSFSTPRRLESSHEKGQGFEKEEDELLLNLSRDGEVERGDWSMGWAHRHHYHHPRVDPEGEAKPSVQQRKVSRKKKRSSSKGQDRLDILRREKEEAERELEAVLQQVLNTSSSSM